MADEFSPWTRMGVSAKKAVQKVGEAFDPMEARAARQNRIFRDEPQAQPTFRVTPEMQDHYAQAQKNFELQQLRKAFESGEQLRPEEVSLLRQAYQAGKFGP